MLNNKKANDGRRIGDWNDTCCTSLTSSREITIFEWESEAVAAVLDDQKKPKPQFRVSPRFFKKVFQFRGHTYALSNKAMNRHDAQRFAKKHGGYLVTLNNDDEDRFVVQTYMSKSHGFILIGYDDIKSEGTWVWDGPSSNYTNWLSGQPQPRNRQENCAGFLFPAEVPGKCFLGPNRTYGSARCQWHDVSCSGRVRVVVEWDDVAENAIADIAPSSSSSNIFSDNFENAYFSKNWNSGGCKEANTLNIVNQRLQSTSNGCYVNLRRKINGDVRIEFDVEKDGYKNHGCHDYQVYWGNDYRVVLLFNKNGQDMLGIGKNAFCGKMDKYVMFKANMLKKKKGKLIISLSKKVIKAQFIEKNGRTLSVIKKRLMSANR